MKRKSTVRLGVTLALGALVVGVAVAGPYGSGRMSGYGMQQGQAMMQGQNYGQMQGQTMMQGRGGMWQNRVDFEARYATIAQELNLTESQISAWTAYTDVITGEREAFLAKRETLRTKHRVVPPTATERLALRTAMLQEQLDSVRKVDAALQSFVAVLTPEQLELFNRISPAGRGGRGAF